MKLFINLSFRGFLLPIFFVIVSLCILQKVCSSTDTLKAESKPIISDTTSQKNDSSSVQFPLHFKPEITIARTRNNSIVLDGKIDDDGWKNAAVVKDFVEINPGDNLKPEVETEVLMTYDDDNIYFAFVNFDRDMSAIRSHVCDRDKIFNDDFCGFMLDTYGESKQCIEIYANPNGVQGDLLMDQSNEDSNYDLIYDSEAKIYKDKWIVEFRIPFKSLRFPDKNEQEWKINLWRCRPRKDRVQISWAPISRDIPSFMSQFGKINGIKNIKSGKNLEILPYALASQAGYLNDNSNPNSGFVNEKVKVKGGIGIKYAFTSNLTGEAAVNPDFSQVESDATQISVNSSFALFYPEKRPFFLEGMNVFTTPYQLVYTRSINDPLYTAKLIGKMGGIDVGYIAGYDIHSPFIIPFEEHTEVLGSDKRSFSNILRFKKSLKEESFIGLMATDRRTGNAHNSLVDFDGLLKFSDNYYFKWQLFGTSTREINDTNLYSSSKKFGNNYTESFNGEYFNGSAGFLDFQRNARHWSFDLNYADFSPGVRADNGFLTSNDFRTINYWTGYEIYTDSSRILNNFTPQVSGDIRYDYSGKFKERFVIPQVQLNFKNQVSGYIWFLLVNDEDYGGIFHKGVHRGKISFDALTSTFIQFGATLELGKFIARFENPPFVGFGFNGELRLTLKPTDRLSLENTYDYSELADKYRGQKLFSGYIFRNKTIYQFSNNLFIRLITQYDAFSGSLEIDPLISYKLNPFTIFYAGSTHSLTDFVNDQNYSRFIQTNRQFFLKLQYLWRI
jgi:hypothetical protein